METKNSNAAAASKKVEGVIDLTTNGTTTKVETSFAEKHDFEKNKKLENVLFVGRKHIKAEDAGTEEDFDVLIFKSGVNGKNYSVPASKLLADAMDKETDQCGTLFTVELTGEIPPTKKGRNATKVFTISRTPLATPVTPEWLNS